MCLELKIKCFRNTFNYMIFKVSIVPPTTVLDDDADNDEYTAPLLRDIDLLSSLLGEVIKSENECVYEVRYLKKQQLHFAS